MKQTCGKLERYEIIEKRFSKLGYTTCASVFNAADFGVAQQRRRAWLMVYRNSDIECSPSRVVSDVNRFQRSYVPFDRCLDVSRNRVDKTSTASEKNSKEGPKWKKAFKDLCEAYGEAWMRSKRCWVLKANNLRLSRMYGVLRLACQGKLEHRLQKIQFKAVSCSEREKAILAVAMEDLAVDHQIDALRELLLIQVESLSMPRVGAGCILLHVHMSLGYVVSMPTSRLIDPCNIEDQNFHRSNYPKSDVRTSTCLIPGGKYIITGPGGFREATPKDRVVASNDLSMKQHRAFSSQDLCVLAGVGFPSRDWTG